MRVAWLEAVGCWSLKIKDCRVEGANGTIVDVFEANQHVGNRFGNTREEVHPQVTAYIIFTAVTYVYSASLVHF